MTYGELYETIPWGQTFIYWYRFRAFPNSKVDHFSLARKLFDEFSKEIEETRMQCFFDEGIDVYLIDNCAVGRFLEVFPNHGIVTNLIKTVTWVIHENVHIKYIGDNITATLERAIIHEQTSTHAYDVVTSMGNSHIRVSMSAKHTKSQTISDIIKKYNLEMRIKDYNSFLVEIFIERNATTIIENIIEAGVDIHRHSLGICFNREVDISQSHLILEGML